MKAEAEAGAGAEAEAGLSLEQLLLIGIETITFVVNI